MNHFGHMADDLTSLEMSIDKMLDLPHAKQLKAALQRAFVEACKASRAQRLAGEPKASKGDSAPHPSKNVEEGTSRVSSKQRANAQRSSAQNTNAAY